MAGASSILLDEHFEAGDPRFLDEVFASSQARKLKAFAKRWVGDARPFAREALLRYIDDGCDRPHHRPLVKALFKLSEAAGDDEAMGRFLVAFDRLLKRSMRTVSRWDPKTRGLVPRVVVTPDKSVRASSKRETDPRFSRRTRRYLQRRAFRYFRNLGERDIARYGRAIRLALAHYQDSHLDSPQKLLDSWGLCNALYGRGAVLSRLARGIVLAPGATLSELAPAPIHRASWEGCLGDIVTLLKKAQSRTVRAFALDWLRSEYGSSLGKIPVLRLRALLLSPHEEVQGFAAELLRSAKDIHLLPIADWLELLTVESPDALEIICDLVVKNVSPARLTLAEIVALGCQRPQPVAELGLEWSKKRRIATDEDLRTLLGFAKAASTRVRAEAAKWVAEELEKSILTKPEHVRDLLDSPYSDVRAEAMKLITKDPRFRDSSVLWTALVESPYDDVRAFLVRHIESRGLREKGGSVRQMWATVLLGIHRGSRAKRRVLTQIADEVARSPERADELLPLFGLALRSVRAPERRSAFAAIARAASLTPALKEALASKLPEIRIESTEAVR